MQVASDQLCSCGGSVGATVGVGAVVGAGVGAGVGVTAGVADGVGLGVAAEAFTVIVTLLDFTSPTLATISTFVSVATAFAVTLPSLSTVTTSFTESTHSTSAVTPSGSNVTLSFVVSPALSVVLPSTSRSISVTFASVHVSLYSAVLLPPSTEALIVTSPFAFAVTRPVELTVAILSSEDVHVTVLSVALSGLTVAV